MTLAASGVSCYEPALAADTCDYWQATLPHGTPDNLWYRFIVTDGTDTDYYADNTRRPRRRARRDDDDPVDNSWALMVYDPAFTSPAWAKDAIIYQIFPDRFRNGAQEQRPEDGRLRYDDPVLRAAVGHAARGLLPQLRGRRDQLPMAVRRTPPPSSPTKEPAGRDYMGGDLKGVDQKLEYLQVARHQHDLPQPDLRLRLEPRLRHPGLHAIDP